MNRVKIKSIKKLNESGHVYDINVPKNHNFFIKTGPDSEHTVLTHNCDYMSLAAQGILRRLMEEYSDNARFIITCNYQHKIIPAIKSRCQQLVFTKFPKDDIYARLEMILNNEGVTFDRDTLDYYINVGYPDIRKIINLLQQNTFNNTLRQHQHSDDSNDYKLELLDLMKEANWTTIRKFLCANVADEEWEDVYKFLYENLDSVPTFSKKAVWEEGIVIIADYLYKHGIVADPLINAAAMFIKLERCSK